MLTRFSWPYKVNRVIYRHISLNPHNIYYALTGLRWSKNTATLRNVGVYYVTNISKVSLTRWKFLSGLQNCINTFFVWVLITADGFRNFEFLMYMILRHKLFSCFSYLAVMKSWMQPKTKFLVIFLYLTRNLAEYIDGFCCCLQHIHR